MSETDRLNASAPLESDLLRTFLAVSETGSISGAAERLFRSQSAVSLRIKRLESIVGQPVFARHARGIKLTATGESLRPIAQQVVGLLDETMAEIRSDSLAGSLRVGLPDEYGQTILPKVLAAFARDHPGIEISVRCALSAGFSEALKRGQLDVAVYDSKQLAPGLLPLRRQRTAWTRSRHHFAHAQKPVPLALFDQDCWWRDQAIDALRQTGKSFRIACSSESVAGVAAAIEAGIAVGVLGADCLGDALVELSPDEGFPLMPESMLVLECRPGLDRTLARAITEVLRGAFLSPTRP